MTTKLRDSQTSFPPCDEPNAVETATGEEEPFASAESWRRETRQLGQVATPRPVAALMARWVMSAKPRTVLDPATGLGGLLSACGQIEKNARLVGVERDIETLKRAKATAPRGAKLIWADYLKSDAGLFDGIIANPPYVKAQRLNYSEKDWRQFEERFGTTLDRLTNLYALFLLKIWGDLAPGGRAAVLVPAEFLNANFGEEIKRCLVREIRPAALMVFAPSVNLFAGTLTTSAIVFLDKATGAPAWAKRVDSIEDAEKFVRKLCAGTVGRAGNGCLDLMALNPRDKWLNVLLNEKARTDAASFPKRVGDYFGCSRGIATGANDFFCLSRADLRGHHLADAQVEPCITKAVDAGGLVFTREKLDALVGRDRRCFLLNPSCEDISLSRRAFAAPTRCDGATARRERLRPRRRERVGVRGSLPPVESLPLARYLQLGQERGIPQRHLPSHRPVWYMPENRAVADIWAAVFSRETVKFILNTSGAKNLTCFHGLYAKPGCECLAPLMTLFLNSSDGRRAFSQVNRFYGGGLNKLEPKDVGDMPCPLMPNLSRTEADDLTRTLADFEKLPLEERTTRIDKLAARYFDTAEERAPFRPRSRRNPAHSTSATFSTLVRVSASI